ncbi:MAG TPA: hypothetical protein VFH01_07340 [Pyrinomonadaceae bacterium]|nr:hypothetical protein [Pyrinomonadaceae bacterium]
MENNFSSTDDAPAFQADLSLPHFDEDATLLSARPVVPLHEVKAETRSRRRRVIFGLTILAAILLGAISATLLLMQSGNNAESAADASVNQPIAPISGVAGGSASESADASILEFEEPDEKPQPVKARGVNNSPNSAIAKRTEAPIQRRSAKSVNMSSSDRDVEENLENDEIELRRAERKEARRAARRENRRHREQTVDDLLRIREIFEGSPRP